VSGERLTSLPDVVSAAQLACLLEVSAPKPGNVCPGHRFHDMGIEAFMASAVAIGEPLRHAGEWPLGRIIRGAVEATARWSRANTNLGMVLLLAPLVRAASRGVDGEDGPVTTSAVRRGVQRVLDETTVEDAREVYAAIRRATPGGLGTAPDQDIAADPTMTLLEVMRLAADRDDVAREYATGFDITFATAVPALTGARRDDLSWEDAIVETFLVLLAARPDTHVRRRAGAAAAAAVSRQAAEALAAGGVRSDAGRRTIADMDRALRGPTHLLNPGTTADLTTAAIFVVLAAGGWHDRMAAATAAPHGSGGDDARTR
jgi:triphosphoribosyl-dephospho-CoA synthase